VNEEMLEMFIAMRYLRSGKGSGFAHVVTWFSFIGIMLGVATLIIVTSVMNGFRIELLDKIVGMKGHIVVTGSYPTEVNDYPSIVKKIKNSSNEIMRAIPQVEKQVILMMNGNARGVIVHGISENDLKSKNLISKNIKIGSMNPFLGDVVLIGKRMAEVLGLNVGNKINLLLPDGTVTPFGNVPKEKSYKIVGIFEVGMYDYDKNIIIMPIDECQSFFNCEKSVNQIEIYLRDGDKAMDITSTISNLIGSRFRVLDWQHSDASIFHAVVVEKNVMTLILSIIVLVAIFNIISGLTMLTSSKRKDIAILRTIGATRQSILRMFFYIGAIIGGIGTIVGAITGIFISLNIDHIKEALEKLSHSSLFGAEVYYLSQIPSKLDWNEVLWITGMSIVMCLIASIYPSRRIARLDPVEAMRN
jgi:lipoprotein-releasing system permease protein